MLLLAVDSGHADVAVFLVEHRLQQIIHDVITNKLDDFTDLLLRSSRQQMWELMDKQIPDISGVIDDCQFAHGTHGQTCLHYLAMGGQVSLAVRLLRLIKCPEMSPSCIGQVDNCEKTPYWYSVANAHWSLAAVFLIYGANPAEKSPWPGRLGGMVEVRMSDSGDQYTIDLPRLLTAGMFANAASCSILHAVCAMGETALVKMLCKERPELATTLDDDGRSALFYAAYNGHKDVIQVLVSLDVDWLSIDAAVFSAAALYALKQARNIGLFTTSKHNLSKKEKTSLFLCEITDQLAYTTRTLAGKEPPLCGKTKEAGLNNADECIAAILQSLGTVKPKSTSESDVLSLAAVVIGSRQFYTSLQSANVLAAQLQTRNIATALTTSTGKTQSKQLKDVTEHSVSLFELALHFLMRRITVQSRNSTLSRAMDRETVTLLMSQDNEASGLLATTASSLLTPVMRTLLEVDRTGACNCDPQSYLRIFSFALKNAPDCATQLANVIRNRPDSGDRDALACLALQEAVYHGADATVQALLKVGQNPTRRIVDVDGALGLAEELPVRHFRPTWSALHVAIARGHSSLFVTLWNVVENYSSPSVVNGSDMWNELLYMSAAYGNDEVRTCLTGKGCQYTALSNDVDGLLSRKIDTRSMCLTAVKNGHERYAETVFGDVTSHATALYDDDEQINIYHYAAYNGLSALTKSLLEQKISGFNRPDEYGVTPVQYAQASGHLDTLRVLLGHAKAAGKSPTLSSWGLYGVLRAMEPDNVSVGHSPTCISCPELTESAGSFESVAVQYIAHALAVQRDHMAWVCIQAVQPDLVDKDATSQTLLHYAAAAGCVNSLTLLLDTAKQQNALKVCVMEDDAGHTGMFDRGVVTSCE